jgi:predicted glycosyltransferase
MPAPSALEGALAEVPSQDSDITIVDNHPPYKACDTWRNKVLERISRLHPMLVVVSSFEARESAKELKDLLQDWAAGYGPVYRRLVSAADHVVVLLDPWSKNDAVECVSSYPL